MTFDFGGPVALLGAYQISIARDDLLARQRTEHVETPRLGAVMVGRPTRDFDGALNDIVGDTFGRKSCTVRRPRSSAAAVSLSIGVLIGILSFIVAWSFGLESKPVRGRAAVRTDMLEVVSNFGERSTMRLPPAPSLRR